MDKFIRSPLKYTGSKYSMLGHIMPELKGFSRLIEPFCGSGVVTLNALAQGIKSVDINDVNSGVVAFVYNSIVNKQALISVVDAMFTPENNNDEFYARCVKAMKQSDDYLYKAAAYYFVNRHSYGGIQRENKSGIFNVSRNKTDKPINTIGRILSAGDKGAVSVSSMDALKHLELVLRSDLFDSVVYIDPPYLSTNDSKHNSYNGRAFTESDHEELAFIILQLHLNGAKVIVSSSSCEKAWTIYSKTCSRVKEVVVPSKIRKKQREELLFIWE